MLRLNKLVLVNGGAATDAAIGSAAILHWQSIPPDVRIAIVKTADLLQPLRKERESYANRT
jgi:hypothetical protein